MDIEYLEYLMKLKCLEEKYHEFALYSLPIFFILLFCIRHIYRLIRYSNKKTLSKQNIYYLGQMSRDLRRRKENIIQKKRKCNQDNQNTEILYNQLKMQYSQLMREDLNLKTDYDNIKKINDENEQKITSLAAKNADLMKKNADLIEKNKFSKSQYDELQKKSEELQKKLDNFKTQFQSLESSIIRQNDENVFCKLFSE